MNLLHVRFSLQSLWIRQLFDKFSRVKSLVTRMHTSCIIGGTQLTTQRNTSHIYTQCLNKALSISLSLVQVLSLLSLMETLSSPSLTPLLPVDHHHGTRKLLKQPSHLLKHKLKTYTDSLTQNTDRHRHRSPKPNTHTDTDAHTWRNVHIKRQYPHVFMISSLSRLMVRVHDGKPDPMTYYPHSITYIFESSWLRSKL